MNQLIPGKINVPAGSSFTSCQQPDSETDEWVTCGAPKILRADGYLGELRISTTDDVVGSFYSPAFADCQGPPPDKFRSCKIELTLNRVQLEQLDNPKVDTFLVNIPPDEDPDPDVFPTTPSPPDINGETIPCEGLGCVYDFTVQNVLYISGFGILLLLLVFYRGALSRLIFVDDRQRKPSKTRQSVPRSSVSAESADFRLLQTQVSSLDQRFSEILRRLDKIDTRFLELEQRAAVSSSQSLSVRDLKREAGLVQPQAAIQPPQPPKVIPPLTVGLITDAVLNADYSLIAPYPHLFLDENSDSRQGRFERKRFDVQGDQRQATSYSNSEFVAITLDSTTYLIPNLLPNAADPRRTMKRLTDSNSVYRGGSGSNILRITRLAVLQALSSNSFELLSDGHVE